jgi:hypothetical protein
LELSAFAQSQTNPNATPKQKSGMCDPNDKFVNTTESRICSIPSRPTNTTSAENNTTTGTEAPSAVPST